MTEGLSGLTIRHSSRTADDRSREEQRCHSDDGDVHVALLVARGCERDVFAVGRIRQVECISEEELHLACLQADDDY